MAVPATFADTYTVVASPADATETVIAQLNGVSTFLRGQTIKVFASANITPGASSTAVVLKLRKNSVSGTQLGVSSGVGIAAAQITSGVTVTIDAADVSENVAGAIYVLTATVTTAGAASPVNAVHLWCRVD